MSATGILYRALGLSGDEVLDVWESATDGRVRVLIEAPRERLRCRACGSSRVHVRDRAVRTWQSALMAQTLRPVSSTGPPPRSRPAPSQASATKTAPHNEEPTATATTNSSKRNSSPSTTPSTPYKVKTQVIAIPPNSRMNLKSWVILSSLPIRLTIRIPATNRIH